MTGEENRKFRNKLMRLVLPIAFQQFMLACVSAADALMLGNLAQDAMAAVSLAGQVTFVFNLFLAALTIGGNMFAAQYWGKGDRDTVEKILGMILRYSMAVSAVFFLVSLCFPEFLMGIFTDDPAIAGYGVEYLRMVSPSYLLCGASQMYLCIMKNSDRALQSTMISSAAVVVNIVLNGVLIYGLAGAPQMGAAGAALATVLARALELFWAVWDSYRPGCIRFRLRYFLRTETELTKKFWKYTLPVLANELVWGCGFAMYSVIMGHLGSDAVAANSVATIVKNLVVCFCLGIGSGGSIIVGNELGAGRLTQAKIYAARLCRICIAAGILSGLFIVALTPLILQAVTLTPQAEEYLKWMLFMCSYYMLGKAINSTTIAGIFCAGGDSKFGFLCDTIVMWCVTVPLGLLTAFVWKLPVLFVYFVINLDEMVKLPAVYRHYRKYIWVKDLTQRGE